MNRKEHLVRIILNGLKKSDLPRSRLTNLIKNYEKDFRQQAIEEVIRNCYVEFYSGESGRGRKPLMVRITSNGLSRLDSMPPLSSDRSVWSV